VTTDLQAIMTVSRPHPPAFPALELMDNGGEVTLMSDEELQHFSEHPSADVLKCLQRECARVEQLLYRAPRLYWPSARMLLDSYEGKLRSIVADMMRELDKNPAPVPLAELVALQISVGDPAYTQAGDHPVMSVPGAVIVLDHMASEPLRWWVGTHIAKQTSLPKSTVNNVLYRAHAASLVQIRPQAPPLWRLTMSEVRPQVTKEHRERSKNERDAKRIKASRFVGDPKLCATPGCSKERYYDGVRLHPYCGKTCAVVSGVIRAQRHLKGEKKRRDQGKARAFDKGGIEGDGVFTKCAVTPAATCQRRHHHPAPGQGGEPLTAAARRLAEAEGKERTYELCERKNCDRPYHYHATNLVWRPKKGDGDAVKQSVKFAEEEEMGRQDADDQIAREAIEYPVGPENSPAIDQKHVAPTANVAEPANTAPVLNAHTAAIHETTRKAVEVAKMRAKGYSISESVLAVNARLQPNRGPMGQNPMVLRVKDIMGFSGYGDAMRFCAQHDFNEEKIQTVIANRYLITNPLVPIMEEKLPIKGDDDPKPDLSQPHCAPALVFVKHEKETPVPGNDPTWEIPEVPPAEGESKGAQYDDETDTDRLLEPIEDVEYVPNWRIGEYLTGVQRWLRKWRKPAATRPKKKDDDGDFNVLTLDQLVDAPVFGPPIRPSDWEDMSYMDIEERTWYIGEIPGGKWCCGSDSIGECIMKPFFNLAEHTCCSTTAITIDENSPMAGIVVSQRAVNRTCCCGPCVMVERSNTIAHDLLTSLGLVRAVHVDIYTELYRALSLDKEVAKKNGAWQSGYNANLFQSLKYETVKLKLADVGFETPSTQHLWDRYTGKYFTAIRNNTLLIMAQEIYIESAMAKLGVPPVTSPRPPNGKGVVAVVPTVAARNAGRQLRVGLTKSSYSTTSS